MTTFETDFARSHKYLPHLKRIVGECFVATAPAHDDQKCNTDLVVFGLAPSRIACRIRRRKYFDRYPDEFTIRSERHSGVKTELAKIVEGWGDYLIYGFADETDVQLHAWVMCDLKVFRRWFVSYLVSHKGELPGASFENADGSSSFRAFALGDMPSDFVLARVKPAPVKPPTDDVVAGF